MKIYTKTGDQGETGLFGNIRVPKDDLRIRAYGTADELNACLGVVVAALRELRPSPQLQSQGLIEILLRIQGELFQLGAELATLRGRKVATQLLDDSHIGRLESEIDAMEEMLSPLKTFILPGGTQVSSLLHLTRTVSRRFERELVSLHRQDPCRNEVLSYVNRLSDYFFVMARFANVQSQPSCPDVAWIAP
jgi:cob(I)alamin adenosyltransferase